MLANNLSKGAHICPICGEKDTAPWLRAPDRLHSRILLYDLRYCPSCSLVWVSNPPPISQIGDHYGAKYDRIISNASESSSRRWRKHLSTLQTFTEGGVLLDIGCGSGSFLNACKSDRWELHGVEMSLPTAKLAAERTGATVFCGDLLDAQYSSNMFDVITSFDVLEHMPDPVSTIRQIVKWLKPGGVFYVFIPNIMAWEARLFRSYWYGLEMPRHLYHYSPSSLRNLLASMGLRERMLITPPINYVEYSIRYVTTDLLRSFGYDWTPLAEAQQPGVAWRVLRKSWRWTALALFSRASSLAGAGPAIEAVFAKE